MCGTLYALTEDDLLSCAYEEQVEDSLVFGVASVGTLT